MGSRSPSGRRAASPVATFSGRGGGSPAPGDGDGSPRLSGLWSTSAIPRSRDPPSLFTATLVLGSVLVAIVSEIASEAAFFGASNGRYISFLKSVHSTNYYWFRSRYTSRSIVGSLVLKYAGSTIISMCLHTTPIWSTNPRHVVSYLLAFALVRSDSV